MKKQELDFFKKCVLKRRKSSQRFRGGEMHVVSQEMKNISTRREDFECFQQKEMMNIWVDRCDKCLDLIVM